MTDRKLSDVMAHAATQQLNSGTVVVTPCQCAVWADRVADMEQELAAWRAVKGWLAANCGDFARIGHDGRIFWAEMNDDTILVTDSVHELAAALRGADG